MKKIPTEKSLLEQILLFLKLVYKMEFKTDAGKINSLTIMALVIMTILIIVPDRLFIIANFILGFFSDKQLPQLPDYIVLVFIVGIIFTLCWCVWIVLQSEKQDGLR